MKNISTWLVVWLLFMTLGVIFVDANNDRDLKESNLRIERLEQQIKNDRQTSMYETIDLAERADFKIDEYRDPDKDEQKKDRFSQPILENWDAVVSFYCGVVVTYQADQDIYEFVSNQEGYRLSYLVRELKVSKLIGEASSTSSSILEKRLCRIVAFIVETTC